MTRRLGVIACALAILAIDQWTKAIVLNTPALGAKICLATGTACGHIELGPLFDLSMVWNRGVSFGMFQSDGIGRLVLMLVSSLIALGFACWMLRTRTLLTAYVLALIVGGAAGNLIDRARFGAVIDFLDFSGLFFPFVFNLADASISLGALILLIRQSLAPKQSQG